MSMKKVRAMVPPPSLRPTVTGKDHAVSYGYYLGAMAAMRVLDRGGNAYSATLSDASDDTPTIPGTGLAISSRGCQSRLIPGHPSEVKRDPATGRLHAGADPRREAYAMAW